MKKGSVIGLTFIFLFLSIPMAWVLSRLSLNQWKVLARFGFSVSVLLLLIVQVIGKSVNGNHNWISLGFVDVQPSEIAKFMMILWAGFMLALSGTLAACAHLGRHRPRLQNNLSSKRCSARTRST